MLHTLIPGFEKEKEIIILLSRFFKQAISEDTSNIWFLVDKFVNLKVIHHLPASAADFSQLSHESNKQDNSSRIASLLVALRSAPAEIKYCLISLAYNKKK